MIQGDLIPQYKPQLTHIKYISYTYAQKRNHAGSLSQLLQAETGYNKYSVFQHDFAPPRAETVAYTVNDLGFAVFAQTHLGISRPQHVRFL